MFNATVISDGDGGDGREEAGEGGLVYVFYDGGAGAIQQEIGVVVVVRGRR